MKREGNGELKCIQGSKASSHTVLLHKPLGLAVMRIGHADDPKCSAGDVLQEMGPSELKVYPGHGARAHLSGTHGLACNHAQARDEAGGLGNLE